MLLIEERQLLYPESIAQNALTEFLKSVMLYSKNFVSMAQPAAAVAVKSWPAVSFTLRLLRLYDKEKSTAVRIGLPPLLHCENPMA